MEEIKVRSTGWGGHYKLSKRRGGWPGKLRVAATSVCPFSGRKMGEAKGVNFGWMYNATPLPIVWEQLVSKNPEEKGGGRMGEA